MKSARYNWLAASLQTTGQKPYARTSLSIFRPDTITMAGAAARPLQRRPLRRQINNADTAPVGALPKSGAKSLGASLLCRVPVGIRGRTHYCAGLGPLPLHLRADPLNETISKSLQRPLYTPEMDDFVAKP